MKKEGNIFYEAGKLYRAAYAAAETALLEAGPAGVGYGTLFTLCREECKRQFPSLNYTYDHFDMTLQNLRLNDRESLRTFRDSGMIYRYYERTTCLSSA